MKLYGLLLPVASAFALLCVVPSAGAATADEEWKTLEQSMENPTPPTMADCAKYTTESAKTECMDYVNKKPTFMYRAQGNERVGSDKAAIRYCSGIGKTYQFTGVSPTDPMMMTYTCK